MGLAVSSRAAVTLHSIRGLTPLIFQHCPLFHCRFIALKSRTFVVKSRTTFAIKFVRDLNAKSTPMGDCGRGCLRRGAPQGICDPSLGRASQTQFRKHRRSGKSTGLEPQYSLQTPATVPATASDSSLLPWKRGRKPDESLLVAYRREFVTTAP